MMNNWKQPIPTNIEADFGEDSIAFTLYIMLLYKACNKDTVVNFGGNKLIELKRGQTIFGRNKWKNYFGVSSSGIEKILKRLEKVTCKVTCERTKNCTVVTIKNYDELISMSQAEEQVSNMSVTSEWQVSNTSKSVYSEKSVKTTTSMPKDLEELVAYYKEKTNRSVGEKGVVIKNFPKWKKIHTLEDMKRAVDIACEKGWIWQTEDGKPWTLSLMLKTENARGACDYISQLIDPSFKATKKVLNSNLPI